MARLLVDAMCGRLARYLRFCGHDTVYAPDRDLEADDALAAVADREGRTLITRDRSLAAEAEAAILLTERDIDDQLAAVQAAGISLTMPEHPERCGRCNGRLRRRSPSATDIEYVPDDFDGPTFVCVRCGQIFWRGSHWDRVAARLASVRGDND